MTIVEIRLNLPDHVLLVAQQAEPSQRVPVLASALADTGLGAKP